MHKRLEDQGRTSGVADITMRTLEFSLGCRSQLAQVGVESLYSCSSGLETMVVARREALKVRILEGEKIEKVAKDKVEITPEVKEAVATMLQDTILSNGLARMLGVTKTFPSKARTDFADVIEALDGFFPRLERSVFSGAIPLISQVLMTAYIASDAPKPSLNLAAMRRELEVSHIKTALTEFAQSEFDVSLH